MNTHKKSYIKTAVLLCLIASTSSAYAGYGSYLALKLLADAIAYPFRTRYTEKIQIDPNNGLPARSQDLVAAFNAHDALRINDLRAIILDYYCCIYPDHHNSFTLFKRLTFTPNPPIELTISGLAFSSDSTRLEFSLHSHNPNPCQNLSYLCGKKQFALTETTNPLPNPSHKQLPHSAHSPEALYLAKAGIGAANGNCTVIIYRNNTLLLANALGHTTSKNKEKRS